MVGNAPRVLVLRAGLVGGGTEHGHDSVINRFSLRLRRLT
jgi:hypothetical protein